MLIFKSKICSEKKFVKWACFNIKRTPENIYSPKKPHFRYESKVLRGQNGKKKKQFGQEKESYELDSCYFFKNKSPKNIFN